MFRAVPLRTEGRRSKSRKLTRWWSNGRRFISRVSTPLRSFARTSGCLACAFTQRSASLARALAYFSCDPARAFASLLGVLTEALADGFDRRSGPGAHGPRVGRRRRAVLKGGSLFWCAFPPREHTR